MPGPSTKETRRLPEVKGIVKMLCDSDSDDPDEERAVVLVGNDPFVGWVASQLLGGSRTIGLAHGEIACLSRRRTGKVWRLEWTLAPDDRSAVEPLLAKIRSKMDTAKVLGGIVVALLTFLVQSFFEDGVPSPAALVALGCFAAGAWLYLAALFFYDGLLMPARWWGSRVSSAGRFARMAAWRVGRVVERPPSSTARVLQQNMVGVWAVCSYRRPC